MTKDEGLLEVIKVRFDDCNSRIEDLSKKVETGNEFKAKVEEIASQINVLKQMVKEYREWKDPNNIREKVDQLPVSVDRMRSELGELSLRLQKFEQKEWLRILSDEELLTQIKLSGKTLKDFQDKFKNLNGPEHAHMYKTAMVKDHSIRWQIYRFCGGA